MCKRLLSRKTRYEDVALFCHAGRHRKMVCQIQIRRSSQPSKHGMNDTGSSRLRSGMADSREPPISPQSSPSGPAHTRQKSTSRSLQAQAECRQGSLITCTCSCPADASESPCEGRARAGPSVGKAGTGSGRDPHFLLPDLGRGGGSINRWPMKRI